ncbi:UDP-4-amino-4,6-dideoxy-N-acetyl-beta-L-altrosamine transaminase [Marinimicrobium locisalis]|uniref:UDP-4-amino-4, 6-dideoxy-N-acetyl-beta-L-altrosamine transaminase n=1 Tax=Marinimicrobium locisalis TaxID=546022 RepID=UPI0032221057
MIPYGRQHIDDKDIEAVVETLQSDFLTQGPCVPAFEQAISDRVNSRHAIAVNSATSALHLACLALGVGSGDRVWTSPITFVASANCARMCGAEVDFVDIDLETGNMSVSELASRLESANARGELPKVIIPVHLCGQPCDMREIHELAQQYGVRLIEDAAHALGATYQGEPVGNGRYSDITVFSFHPVKMITTGEGGMACTNHSELAQRMAELRSHGIVREPERMAFQADGPWYYEQQALGFNYRMTDLQAALGLSQLKRLDDFVERRRELAENYRTALADLAIQPLVQRENRESSCHLYVIRLPWVASLEEKRRCVHLLHSEGVGVQVHYIPLYRQPYYRECESKMSLRWMGAEAYYREAISLPLYPWLNNTEQEHVVDVLHRLASHL